MALKYQRYVDLPDGQMIGIHVLTPLYAAGTETITVAELAKHSLVTTGDAVKQVTKTGQTLLGTAPATASLYGFTVTWTAAEIAAEANDEIIILTNHRKRRGNFTPEDTTPYSL